MKHVHKFYWPWIFMLLIFTTVCMVYDFRLGLFPLCFLLFFAYQWFKSYQILVDGVKYEALIVEYDDGQYTFNDAKELALICMYFDGEYKIVKVPTLQVREEPFGKSRFVQISVYKGKAMLVERKSYFAPEHISEYEAVGIWHAAYGKDEPPAWLL